jgi:hypothetical protein
MKNLSLPAQAIAPLAIALGATLSGVAQAGPADPCSLTPFGWSAGASPTLVEGCFEGDKYFQGLSTNLPTAWTSRTDNVDIAVLPSVTGGTYILEYSELEHANLQLGTPYFLRGTAQVLPSAVKAYISLIDLDLEGAFGPNGELFSATVTKKVYGDADFTDLLLTLTSTGGFTFGAIPWRKQVWFEDTIVLNSGTLLSLENSFRQSVPTPATLALVMVALGGAAVTGKRRAPAVAA